MAPFLPWVSIATALTAIDYTRESALVAETISPRCGYKPTCENIFTIVIEKKAKLLIAPRWSVGP